MSKIFVRNVSMLQYPSKRFCGTADVKIIINKNEYLFINNIGIYRKDTGEYFIEFPIDWRSDQRNKDCIAASRELRQRITDEVLSHII